MKWQAPAGGSFSGCQLYRDTALTVPNTSETTVGFDLENIDVGGYHSNTTNNSRVTVPSGKAGYYYVQFFAGWASNATGRRFIQIRKNGNQYIDATDPLLLSTGVLAQETGQILSFLIYLAEGDYVEATAWQSSGGNLDLLYPTSFSVFLIGA